ncbi:cyclin-P3-1-like [Rhodamnia argentea]|uniref:Cyclin-P3-1-like n=1 Tax=Rhodamnia argentea TaxID=178133 RepID=A0A8B8QEE7_9MYRT|nr:cyclin-P3-1-like [Rhodamnia argentea]
MEASKLDGGDPGRETYASLGLDSSGEEDAGTPRILFHIASALEKSIRRNEKLPKAWRRKEAITIFHGSRAPAMSVGQYLERICKYSSCSTSCFVVAYIYINRFLERTGGCLTSLNVHRLLITSVVVASKFIDDAGSNNAYFAKVGGISNAEMNRMEVNFLFKLDFRLYVSPEEFKMCCSQLQTEGNSKYQIDRSIKCCGIREGWLKKDSDKCTSTIAGLSCRAI